MNIKVAVITVSDRSARGEREDQSGPALSGIAREKRMDVVLEKVVPDEMNVLTDVLQTIAESGDADLILTTGGTGFAQRDVTPEATKSVIQREVPGIPEMIRAESAKITNRAYLSRGTAGLRNRTLIINLPGSPKAAMESFEIIYPILDHGLDVLSGNVVSCGEERNT